MTLAIASGCLVSCQHQLSKMKEQGTCYIQLCYITHLRIHAIKICSKLHVIIHGYIVTVWYVNIYIYIYIHTTILPWSCTDGRYFYHISGTPVKIKKSVLNGNKRKRGWFRGAQSVEKGVLG